MSKLNQCIFDGGQPDACPEDCRVCLGKLWDWNIDNMDKDIVTFDELFKAEGLKYNRTK